MNFKTTADWGGYLKDSGGLSRNVGGPFNVDNNNINGNHNLVSSYKQSIILQSKTTP